MIKTTTYLGVRRHEYKLDEYGLRRAIILWLSQQSVFDKTDRPQVVTYEFSEDEDGQAVCLVVQSFTEVKEGER